jgi:cyclohexa-1,5-dienecarbonyl-CoA hydratase
MSAHIISNVEKNLATITLMKDPLNILDIEDLQLINKLLCALNEDKNIKCLVIKTALKNFSAGIDIKEHNEKDIIRILNELNTLTENLLNFSYPTVSAIKGMCLGGAMEIALLTDITLVSRNAKLGQPEIKLAHMAPLAIALLPSITGYKKAAELILTARTITAEEAVNYNIANKIFEDDQFDIKSDKLINNLTGYSKTALKSNVTALRKPLIESVKNKSNMINEIYLKELIKHPDSLEGVNAFCEKRNPIWQE